MTEYWQPRTTHAEATINETTVQQHQYVTCSHVVKGWGDDLAGTQTEPVTLCTPPWHVLREALYGVVQSTIHNANTQNHHHHPNSNNTMLLRTFDTDDSPSVDVAYVMVVGASARTKRKGNNVGRGKKACTMTTSENTNYPSTDPYVNGISVPKFRLLMDENDMVHHTDVHNNTNAVYTTDPQPILAAHDPWDDNQNAATNDDQQDSLLSKDRMIVTNDHPILSLEKLPEHTIAAVDQGLANIRVTTCTILGGDLDSIDALHPSATAPMDMTNELQESPKTTTTTTTIVSAEKVPEPFPHPRFRLLVD
jgi:hypothetical protein